MPSEFRFLHLNRIGQAEYDDGDEINSNARARSPRRRSRSLTARYSAALLRHQAVKSPFLARGRFFATRSGKITQPGQRVNGRPLRTGRARRKMMDSAVTPSLSAAAAGTVQIQVPCFHFPAAVRIAGKLHKCVESDEVILKRTPRELILAAVP